MGYQTIERHDDGTATVHLFFADYLFTPVGDELVVEAMIHGETASIEIGKVRSFRSGVDLAGDYDDQHNGELLSIFRRNRHLRRDQQLRDLYSARPVFHPAPPEVVAHMIDPEAYRIEEAAAHEAFYQWARTWTAAVRDRIARLDKE